MKRTDQDETVAAEPTDERASSRRRLLRLAGGAAVGGAGLILAGADKASAADGDPIIMGDDNDSGGTLTGLNSDAVVASFNVGTQGLSGGISGINAAGSGNFSDVKLTGTGRLGFVAGPAGNTAPSSTTFVHNSLAMSQTGVLWAGAEDTSSWKRINAVRVDHPNGTGNAFAPFRLYDSRNSSVRTVGTTTNVDVRGHANIPDDAVAIFGNLTVTSPNFDGWVTLWPRGVAEPGTSSINFRAGANNSVANFFFVGLGTGGAPNVGQISFGPRKSGAQSGSVHVIIDVTAYVQ